ncbi:MAG: transposase [Sterolibacterium sp.]|nr:transposase [Sterolibacterium sp.]MBP9800706.1 transposase [Sterolibacterium sp.]
MTFSANFAASRQNLAHPLLLNSLFSGKAAMEAWAMKEFSGAALGDDRLNQRLVKLATRFADKPTASIPGACADWSETQAAYRFFEQSSEKKRKLGWQDILAPHVERTEARMRQHAVVLCLQDTTELDFNGQEAAGLGPLSYEAQRGMYLHPTYVVTPARTNRRSRMEAQSDQNPICCLQSCLPPRLNPSTSFWCSSKTPRILE